MAVLSVRGVDEALMEKMRDGARLRRVPLRKYVLELLSEAVKGDPADWYRRDFPTLEEIAEAHPDLPVGGFDIIEQSNIGST